MSRAALAAAAAVIIVCFAGCRNMNKTADISGISGKLELEYAGKVAVKNLLSSRTSDLLSALGSEYASAARKQELSDLASQMKQKVDFELLYSVSCESSDYCTLLAGKRADALEELRKTVSNRILLEIALAFTDIICGNTLWDSDPAAREMLSFRRMELAACLGCRSDELPELAASSLAVPAVLKKYHPLPPILRDRYKDDFTGLLHYAYILFSFPQELARRIEADKKFAVNATVRNALDLGCRYRIALAEQRLDHFLSEYRSAGNRADKAKALRSWRRWYYRREFELKRLYNHAEPLPENQFVGDLLMLSDEL